METLKDIKEKQEARKNLFKEVNQRRGKLRSALNQQTSDLNAQELDLKAGGEGDLEAIRKRVVQRKLPPDYKEKSLRFEELLQKEKNTPSPPKEEKSHEVSQGKEFTPSEHSSKAEAQPVTEAESKPNSSLPNPSRTSDIDAWTKTLGNY